ncbi:major Facilitator Superfamily protein [Methylomusa anaerophila]|uniref:Major Facilitator Superfamily protein n=2 Tax=Methylomusa anaerophila TaxID=1930071 RepID=A0A348AHX9_9FIRM|nr:major Facilitator Superfamily protein [Methylomusa anaerophila]
MPVMAEPKLMNAADKKKLAVQFILLFGVVSALGDITYEGARSIYGPYLGFLGASAAVIGLITGIGEFLGYFLRLVSGYFVDRTGQYWLITILGYGMLIAVPLLAIAGNWQVAVIFIMLERIGKAIRSPAKDALLSYATKRIGTGLGFGIHEALDQTGAVIGPLLFAAGLAINGNYTTGFHIMWIPAILTVAVVVATRLKVPNPAMLEEDVVHKPAEQPADKKLSKAFWLYAVFTFLSVLGFANFQLISYHWQVKEVVAAAAIPTLYAVAMAVDAVGALIIGKTYDKKGMISLIAIPVLTVAIPFLGFSDSYVLVVAAAVLWGVVMSIHETIMRAAIADMTPIGNRGFAYGIFNMLYGTAWFVGSAAMGLLYDMSVHYIFSFVAVIEIIAIFVFLLLRSNLKHPA